MLPENYSYDLSRAELELTWEESTDEENHDVTYDLAFGTSKSFLYTKIIAQGIQFTSFIPDSLELDQTYYWMVRADDGYGESAFSEVRSFKLTHEGGVSINNLTEAENALEIYPNPSTGQFTILNRTELGGDIRIYDLIGRLVFNTMLIDTEQSIDLHQADGLYLVTFRSKNHIENRTIEIK